MPRPRVISLSQIQDEEVPNIESHHDYINRVLKWSIADLERFIGLLRQRVAAEEAYVLSLTKITSKAHITPEADPNQHVAHTDTTYHRATMQYERSLEQLVVVRRKMIQSIQQQIDMLVDVKEKQENRRKKVKTILGDTNSAYIGYRTRDIVKLHKSYVGRCMDLQNAQHQLQQQIQQQQQQQPHQNLSPNSSEIDLRDNDTQQQRLSSDEPRPRLSTDNDSISSQGDTPVKKGMASFMAQVRTQFANAAAASAVQEVTRQNAKCARITTEIATADLEYRDGIRKLEMLRRKQVDIASTCVKQVETVFKDKFEATRAALGDLVYKEKNMISEESMILEYLSQSVNDIDSNRDIIMFNKEYQKRGFVNPSPIHYTNYYHGEAKDLIFGTSLEDYGTEHNRTVPLIVLKCVDAVERMGGLQKEGIYRVSGRQSNVDSLKSAFEQNEQAMDLHQSKYDVTTIAAILKVYLRELKHPLFGLSVQSRMEYATLDRQLRLTRLQSKISSLPKIHRDTLHTVMRHLANVNKHSNVNKMNIQNLSVVFTPAIFHDHNNSGVPGEWHTDCVFEDMLLYHEPLFHNAEIESQNNSAANITANRAVQSPSSQAAQTPGGGNKNMLLTAPLYPGNLTGQSDYRPTGQQHDPHHHMPPRVQEVPQQQRSTSLGVSPMPANQAKYTNPQHQHQHHAPPPHYQPQLQMQSQQTPPFPQQAQSQYQKQQHQNTPPQPPQIPQIQTPSHPSPQSSSTPATQSQTAPSSSNKPPQLPQIQTDIHREPSPATPTVDVKKNESLATTSSSSHLPTTTKPTRSSSYQSPTSPDDERSDAATWIGMAAMSGALEQHNTTSGGSQNAPSHSEKPPVITTTTIGSTEGDVAATSSPVSPTESGSNKTSPAMTKGTTATSGGGSGTGGVVPPRQDSLRLQVAQQQVSQQQQQSQPPPIVTSSPHPAVSNNNKQRSRPSPTGPQTPTIAMSVSVADHLPSSAVIVENPVAPTTTTAADAPLSNEQVVSDQNTTTTAPSTTSTLANSLSFGK
ncbi:RhoGAP-domain-containing protein [Lichtheimia hyalospora FSU 10163]|nr:RhoGAP-domain-containing protein [Lichtheimia hyalospora FSU 10163]